MTEALASVDIDFRETGRLGDALLDRLRVMRETDPIYKSAASGVWIVNGHRQVSEGFAGKWPLSAVRLPHLVVGGIPADQHEAKIPYLLKTTREWVVNMDRPEQFRLRTLAQKAFGPAISEGLRPHARAFIREALDEVADLESFDFIDKVARRIPGRTILKLFGLPESHYPRLHHWSVTLNAAFGGANLPEPVIVEAEKVLLEMRDFFLPEIEARRRVPTDDFISALVTAREADGDRLSEEEMLGLLYVALIAGHDTTTNTIALGTAALARMPDARAYMRENPENQPDALMELMRYVAMSTMIPRTVIEDFDWEGHALKKGEMVFLMIAGANRDPIIFPEPDRFDPTRPQAKNMTFGPGLHFCVGHFLAKMQLQEFFTALLERYDPELLDDRLDFAMSLTFRGVDHLNMRLRPAPGR